ncbi:hypothetical protein GP486_006142 [Trichoglossum hirsutum]|uniref:Cytochrome P450 n=1 Tax=Trichoglossum hirsutum TaxID=265104 RepID=A0A9P8RL01_9PEZI|nr:hypothetical protein GP486_006142 [Trichoglossum hirsutum]
MLFSRDLFTNERLLAAGAIASALYLLALSVYRLYFSPIAKFPGPKLAALTFWYEFYYDVIKRGRYTWKIKELHEKYGPIVRINPYELHIDDPEYYDTLYSGPSKKRNKWEWSAKMFGNTKSMLGTVPHDHHRLRRAAVSPYFSKQSVARLEPTIQSVIDILCERIRGFQRSEEPLNLGHAFAALTTDIITEYAYAKTYGFLAKPDFGCEWPAVLAQASEMSHLMKQFGWLYPTMDAMPEWLVLKFNPPLMHLINFQRDTGDQIKSIMEGKNNEYKTASHTTIFHELLNSDILGPEEKTIRRLAEEGQTVVGAGILTTAHMLKLTSFHILANIEVLKKLKAELASVQPNAAIPIPLRKLEQLPYLTGIVNEGLRMSYGASSRLARISPDAPLTFHSWSIPAGTPVSMTSVLIHDNPTIFPSPSTFSPERWLPGNSEKRLDKYLVSFSKGTRACMGMNLAYAEMYMTLATVFSRFDMELWRTTREDVDIVHDFFNPSPKLDSEGVRVLVK